jgi:hypothetical protein
VAKIKVIKKRVEELIPYSRNSRTHSDAQVAQIAASIREFGFMNPVLVDAENNIIAGHGRVLAARKLGLEEVPCVLHDHLTETQRKAYILADNRLALNAGWDDELLKLELQELNADGVDLEKLGFILEDFCDYIGHDGDEKSGASPWERMSGEGVNGVVFSFGSITAKLSDEVYAEFEARVPEQGVAEWIEAMIVNALRDS